MKGVLLKDLYIAKSNIFVTIVSLIVLGFGLSFLLETSALLILAPVASTTAVFISITSDAGSKWNKNVITMPVSRNQIIREIYLLYLACGNLFNYSTYSMYCAYVSGSRYNSSFFVLICRNRYECHFISGRH